MDYLIQEGKLTLPSGFQDRSVNMFVPGVTLPAPFSLTLSRDITLPGESLAEYVERQVGLIAAKLRKYKRQDLQEVWLSTQSPVPGLQVDAHYQNDGRPVYQRQAGFIVSPQRVLVFSATSQQPFDDQLNQLWTDVLASFQQHPPVAGPP
ncbi:DcrB-related protein [Pseudomonas protegens]|uniref:DcrB-related protein n=1 Tax=Pseudomonas protegens TaxID=380021 RepID=UPI000CD14B62|nr:DUF1795 domain-containing protein [Pseudomonas protegens]POA89978.1 DUF1795 domain-containing protein [Pseudomonas protegens]